MAKPKFDLSEGDSCPYCKVGLMRIRHGKYGKFYACDQFPHCAFTQKIAENLDIGMAGFKDKYYSK